MWSILEQATNKNDSINTIKDDIKEEWANTPRVLMVKNFTTFHGHIQAVKIMKTKLNNSHPVYLSHMKIRKLLIYKHNVKMTL